MARIARFKRLIGAIKRGTLNCDNHANGEWFSWFGRILSIKPFFYCGGHRHCGYTICEQDEKCKLEWDFDLQPSFQVLDENDVTLYSEED